MASLVSGLIMSVIAQDVVDNAEEMEVEEGLDDHHWVILRSLLDRFPKLTFLTT